MPDALPPKLLCTRSWFTADHLGRPFGVGNFPTHLPFKEKYNGLFLVKDDEDKLYFIGKRENKNRYMRYRVEYQEKYFISKKRYRDHLKSIMTNKEYKPFPLPVEFTRKPTGLSDTAQFLAVVAYSYRSKVVGSNTAYTNNATLTVNHLNHIMNLHKSPKMRAERITAAIEELLEQKFFSSYRIDTDGKPVKFEGTSAMEFIINPQWKDFWVQIKLDKPLKKKNPRNWRKNIKTSQKISADNGWCTPSQDGVNPSQDGVNPSQDAKKLSEDAQKPFGRIQHNFNRVGGRADTEATADTTSLCEVRAEAEAIIHDKCIIKNNYPSHLSKEQLTEIKNSIINSRKNRKEYNND